jgi:redox-sensitive bicupin YhaK (pirin superfamily)
MTIRTLDRLIRGVATSDGAGVKLTRTLGSAQHLRLDPFLMLDEFASDDAEDYIAGFPSHPHRGFETVTYMLDGHMLHEDHMGNRGDLRPGDVQWMTAGRGVIHSEMPQQKEGRMRGFQLWLNLPAAEKMKPAAYRDIPAAEIPAVTLDSGARIRVIAGALRTDDETVHGPINGDGDRMATDPLYLDIELPAAGVFEQPIPPGHNAFAFVFEGDASVQGEALPHHAAGIFGDGDRVRIDAGDAGARMLLLAGRPIGEPVAQYGPFVMNTPEEIQQALRDFQSGQLTA